MFFCNSSSNQKEKQLVITSMIYTRLKSSFIYPLHKLNTYTFTFLTYLEQILEHMDHQYYTTSKAPIDTDAKWIMKGLVRVYRQMLV